MPSPLPRILSAVPQTWHVRLEIAKAIQALAAPHNGQPDRRAEIAAFRCDLEDVSQELAKAFRKCAVSVRSEFWKYNADEPRVPKGNLDGGEWTRGLEYAASATDDWTSVLRRHGGHHIAPKGVYRKYPFKPETLRVFDNARTGSLKGGHGWSPEHGAYNLAVREALEQYLEKNNIKPTEMTPEQAQEFIFKIIGSRDPRIRDFNLRLYRREIIHYILRHIPMNPDGLESGVDEE